MKAHVSALCAALMTTAAYTPVAAADEDAMLKRIESLEREITILKKLNELEREVIVLRAGLQKPKPETRAPIVHQPQARQVLREPAERAPERTRQAVAAAPTSALEANAKVVAYKAPLAVAPAFSWTGLYIGAHGGFAAQTSTLNDPFSTCAVSCVAAAAQRDINMHSAFGGLQAGLNYQVARLVVGAEATASFGNFRGDRTDTLNRTESFALTSIPPATETAAATATHTWTDKADWFATATTRLGIAGDHWMAYAKGGLAVLHSRYGFLFTNTSLVTVNPPIFGGFSSISTGSLSGSDTRFGVAAGVGAAWAFQDNWSANVDYTFMDFGEQSVSLFGTQGFVGSPTGTASQSTGIRERIHAATVGINYHFLPTLSLTN